MNGKIIFATNNRHKLIEIQQMLGLQFDLVSLKDVGFYEEIPETQPTLEGNALQKARHIHSRYHLPCFADDTGLEVDALGGAPGVYSARYAGSLEKFGSEERRTEANIRKLLQNMSGVIVRSAHFRTVIAYIENEHEFLFEGIVKGHITENLKGKKGFGYDPVFVPQGYTQTFAEMGAGEKNAISHRANAFARFVEFLGNRS